MEGLEPPMMLPYKGSAVATVPHQHLYFLGAWGISKSRPLASQASALPLSYTHHKLSKLETLQAKTCSTNWATALCIFWGTGRTRTCDHGFKRARSSIINSQFRQCSPGEFRNPDISINSRMLCLWATGEYISIFSFRWIQRRFLQTQNKKPELSFEVRALRLSCFIFLLHFKTL